MLVTTDGLEISGQLFREFGGVYDSVVLALPQTLADG
jgi:hypothetical protein